LRQKLGVAGEQAAARYLRSLGYKILESRYRCPRGEIDLIVRDGTSLVFVEVKTRRAGTGWCPEEAITVSKQRRIQSVALWYLAGRKKVPERGVRFDVVAVWASGNDFECRQYPGAFLGEGMD
jgi:putative endonuclease